MCENTVQGYLFKILSLVAKKAITRSWLRNDPPGLSHWLDIVEEIRSMEQMTNSIQIKTEQYTVRCLPPCVFVFLYWLLLLLLLLLLFFFFFLQ